MSANEWAFDPSIYLMGFFDYVEFHDDAVGTWVRWHMEHSRGVPARDYPDARLWVDDEAIAAWEDRLPCWPSWPRGLYEGRLAL